MYKRSQDSQSIPGNELFTPGYSFLLTLGYLDAYASLYSTWLMLVTFLSLTWFFVQVEIMVHEVSTQAVRPI